MIYNLDTNWYYIKDANDAWLTSLCPDGQKINIPHSNIELPYSYFDESEFQFVSMYQRLINLPAADIANKVVVLHFEAIMAKADIYLNGEHILSHSGGYSGFDVDISKHLLADTDNLLTIRVDSNELETIPPFGGCIDYLTYGGIYREAQLIIKPNISIAQLKATAKDIYSSAKSLGLEIAINNVKKEVKSCSINYSITGNDVNYQGSLQVDLQGKEQEVFFFDIENLHGIELWNIETPNLYNLHVILSDSADESTYTTKIGFREARFEADGFYLNNKKLKLRGLNRHQSWPYVGYAMGKRAQEKDADILKHELKLNLVRTSHYMQSRHFLNRCDEIGLLVFEEIPGWQHVGQSDIWRQQVYQDVADMINRDYNHPSIIIWGVRINESADDDELYQETNRLAKSLDKTRNTGGVRCIDNSKLLEDVYTMNDFVLNGSKVALRAQQQVTGLTKKVPYLVTEFNGHMFPTKRIDNEERLMEHAIRHLRVLDAAYGDDDIAGAIGWCAFDYNTHKDFGAGDHICHHGVMDMFRVPKPAAYAYASQCSPEDEVILQPVTVWARGERDECNPAPVLILTNCDYVEFIQGDKSNGYYFPAKDLYKNLPHAPVIIPSVEGDWGFDWQASTFIGYVNNKKVIEKSYCASATAAKFILEADNYQLNALPIDSTRIIAKVVDECGNVLPFLHTPIAYEISGCAEMIGSKIKSMLGGISASWIKTNANAGKVKITATLAELGFSAELEIEVTGKPA